MVVKCCSCWFLIMELFFFSWNEDYIENVLCLGIFKKMDSKIYLPKESNHIKY